MGIRYGPVSDYVRMCLSVCLSVTLVLSKRLNGSTLLWHRCFPRVFQKLRYLQNIGTSSETFPQTLDSEKKYCPGTFIAAECDEQVTTDVAKCCRQQSTDNQHLLITLIVQLCVKRYKWCRVGPSASAETFLLLVWSSNHSSQTTLLLHTNLHDALCLTHIMVHRKMLNVINWWWSLVEL